MKFVTDAKDVATSYTNKYTVGGLAVAVLTGAAAYFSPVAALTFPHVAGLGLLSLTAVAGSYALFLGAKAAYNFVFDIKTEEVKVEAKAEDKAEKKEEVKADAPAEQKPGFISRNWTKVKGWFSSAKTEEAAKPAEVAAPEAPKTVEAPKAVEVAATEAPKAASPRRSPRLNPVAAPVAEAVLEVAAPAVTPALNKARAARVVDVNAKNAIHNRPRRACGKY